MTEQAQRNGRRFRNFGSNCRRVNSDPGGGACIQTGVGGQEIRSLCFQIFVSGRPGQFWGIGVIEAP